MKPWTTIATAPGGYVLKQRDREFLVQVNGKVLMGSRAHASEELLADIACQGLGPKAQVLIGGLGFGFTLRKALDVLPPTAKVVVAELSQTVIDWNRGVLADLAGRPLDDARVQLEVKDVGQVMRKSKHAFDAIVLDVDNGPFAVTQAQNTQLYSLTGISHARLALKGDGRLVVWSAGDDPGFVKRLREVGYDVKTKAAGGRHVVIVATAR